jgi:hypothetical protein
MQHVQLKVNMDKQQESTHYSQNKKDNPHGFLSINKNSRIRGFSLAIEYG